MGRLLAVALASLTIGALATYFLVRDDTPGPAGAANEIHRDLADVPKMTPAAAEQHRASRYEKLTSIEQVLALPTAFAQSEALFLLAGRAESVRVQELIFEANRIADPNDRESALTVLFFRLTELDPNSALALARTDTLAGERYLEQHAWQVWGRMDLTGALAGVQAQTSNVHRNAGAQALFAAFGYMGNERTERIERELGIGPNRSARVQFLQRLADRSPLDAIDYINGTESSAHQQEFVAALAHHLAQYDPSRAATYADRFENGALRNRYRSIVATEHGKENPRLVLDRFLADGVAGMQRSEIFGAVQAIAKNDLDAALYYFDQTTSRQQRQMLGSAIAAEYARRDADTALEWARANESHEYPMLEMAVLRHMAATDPQRALSAAMSGKNLQQRSSMISNILSTVARDDPGASAALLDHISNPQLRRDATQHVAGQWMRTDPDGAIEWMLGQNEELSAELLAHSAFTVVRSDLDAAMRLLPRIGERNASSWRHQIAQNLAAQRSPGEALNFISQFEGQGGYAQLQSAVAIGVAQKDPIHAKQLADQISDAKARDAAYTQIIGLRGQTEPMEAAAWIESITGEQQRSAAAGNLARHWYQHDPQAAQRWVENLPAGADRDSAVIHLAQHWHHMTPEQERLVESIQDPEMRGQAVMRQIMSVVHRDPLRARKLLEDADLPDRQRERLETMIAQITGHM